MQFFEYVKNKIQKRFEQPVISFVKTIPEEEVGLLAIMCKMCQPVVIKDGLFRRVYAYYLVESESDIEIAQEIFSKNGIQMSVHYSHILGKSGEYVLRTDYRLCDRHDKMRHEMGKIGRKYAYLYKSEAKAEKAELYKKVEALRQNIRY